MTMFGLKEAVIAAPVRAIAGEELTIEEVAEHFARASWTGIAEPGDKLAGMLVRGLGAAPTLSLLIERWDAGRVTAALEEALGEPVDAADVSAALERWQPRLTSATALLALSQAARFGARLLTPAHPLWPQGLDELGAHAPLALWVRGRDETLARLGRSISLVGARAATGYGEHVAMEASAGLVDRGFAIVSGAAYGIDGMAHRAALASGGHTVAFLAGGVDRFYPSGHDALLTRIVEAGAVISELPCGAQPTKWRFLQRNRLIAAASQATIVLEAGWRSGSLNTAGHAAALGRPLGAVPGPVTSAASAGCHRLIRDFGAVCVTSAEEMAELAPSSLLRDSESSEGRGDAVREGAEAQADHPDRAAEPTSDTLRVIDALSVRSARTVDDVAARSGLSLGGVQAVLAALELEGGAAERGQGWVRSRPKA